MRYFVFSLILHFSGFALLLWQKSQLTDTENRSENITEIILLDSNNRNADSPKTNLFQAKRKMSKKLKTKKNPHPDPMKFPVFKKQNPINIKRKNLVVSQNMESETSDRKQGHSSKTVHKQKTKLVYLQQLKTYIEQNQFYPRAAFRLNQMGMVKIKMQIDPNGMFKNVTIKQASAHERLNRAALKLVKNLKHFKPLPEIFEKDTPFIIPINYKVTRGSH